MKKITLQISEEFFAFAQQQAAAHAYFSAEDFLNGLLNSVLLKEIDEARDSANAAQPHPRFPPEWMDDDHNWLNELEEDAGGGMRLKEDNDNIDYDDDDLDDGFPF